MPSKPATVRKGVTTQRGSVERKERERQKALAKLVPHLALLRDNLTADGLDVSVSGVAKAIRISKQTLYSHNLHRLVQDVAKERQAALGRIRTARPGARQKIAVLSVERDQWKAKYEALLDRHTRLINALRTHPTVDLETILSTPMEKPNRAEPASTKGRLGRARHLRT